MGIASTLIVVRSALGIVITDEHSFKMTVLGTNEGTLDRIVDIGRCTQSAPKEDDSHDPVVEETEVVEGKQDELA
ncbi:hypothetical protein PM082_024199 [Marasmius tenuissimus]|nr:hypothetical protein PM082_024199 [Marasmius tenuissimus]